MIWRCLHLAALAAVLAAFVPAWASLKSWRDGPVSYLLTPDEYRAYGKLPDDDARRAFIDRFWKEIEGGAAPPGDFRKVFEERCAAADERFASPRAPGWKTDRGRVFIVLGEPSEVKRETGGLRAVETEVWIYGDGGAGRAPERFAFFRCSDGDYRLDAACPEEAAPFSTPGWSTATALQRALERNPGLATARARTFIHAILAPVPASPIAGLGSAPAVSGAASLDAAESEDEDTHVLEPMSYFFRAEDGNVLALLSVELLDVPEAAVSSGSAPLYAAAASVAPLGDGASAGGGRPVSLLLDSRETRQGAALFTGSVYLEPGRTYGVRYTVQDRSRNAVYLRRDRLTAPDLGRGLAVSSIVPAESFGPVAEAPDGAFRIGSEEVVPKPGAAFRRGDLLRLYLQVYGAVEDPRSEAADLDVAFRFYFVRGGHEKRVGKPYRIRRAERASMGLSLSIEGWPDGTYRVAVDIRDRISGERARSEARFTISGD